MRQSERHIADISRGIRDEFMSYEQHVRAWGAVVQPDGSVRFRIWAPAQTSMSLRLETEPADLPLRSLGDGWFEIATSLATAGSRYRFVLGNGRYVPDPASAYQPLGVSGPSEVVDANRFAWTDDAWTGRPWAEAIIYELHIGAFTPEGTFAAAMERLPYLAELGITAVELMPVAAFAGERNWGYDGVFHYAPTASYGCPDDLKAFIDAAHEFGVMVLLDVVYNHFGPEGNFLRDYAPGFFTERHETPWGAGINFDGPDSAAVRRYFIDNAIYWVEEFHVDGLRLDAIHAIQDDSAQHIVSEIATCVRTRMRGRDIHLVLENEENEADKLKRDVHGAPLLFTSQWNDDVHHVLHTAATLERSGYYADYEGDVAKLARSLAEGFAFQGEVMPYRGHPRGQPSGSLPPTAFIAFIQNHDQIGNRAFGERLTALASPEAVRAVAATYLLLPQIPMLFMGEEWGASSAFPFFCDFQGELAQAVREGRRAEFARFPEFADPAQRSRIPDPLDVETFLRAKLDWSERVREPHRSTLGWYRRVLAVRAREIVPRTARLAGHCATSERVGGSALRVSWKMSDDETLTLWANLSPVPAERATQRRGRTIWREGTWTPRVLPAWGVTWTIESPRSV